jgi:ATP-binding cassette subfamily D (ALD) long-chain fatty acid import protein
MLLESSESAKPNIDCAFLSQLRAILFHVAILSRRSAESGLVILHSAFLILRTMLSIMVARLDGLIVRDIVKADGKGFMRGLAL